jgi:hypothetical protein
LLNQNCFSNPTSTCPPMRGLHDPARDPAPTV